MARVWYGPAVDWFAGLNNPTRQAFKREAPNLLALAEARSVDALALFERAKRCFETNPTNIANRVHARPLVLLSQLADWVKASDPIVVAPSPEDERRRERIAADVARITAPVPDALPLDEVAELARKQIDRARGALARETEEA